MLKSKKTIVVLLVVVAVVVAGVLWLKDETSGSLLETVERSGSRVLGTRVDVARADVRWDAGSLSLAEATIANPGGFSDRDMVTVESVTAAGDLRAGDLDELVFDGIDALIELRGAQSNFEVVGERASNDSGGDGSGERDEAGGEQESAAEDEDEEGQDGDQAEDESMFPDEWRIAAVSFRNMRVTVRADWTDEQASFDVDNLTLEDLNGRVDDLTRSVVIGFLSNVLATGADQVEDSRLKESLAGRAEELREKMRALEAGGGQGG